MKVRVIKSFVGSYEEDGVLKSISAGMNDVIDLPEKVDWLQAGLVEPVKEAAETTTLRRPEDTMLPPAVTFTPLGSLGLPARIEAALMGNGITSVEELAAVEDLTDLSGIGPASAVEIHKRL